MFRNLPRKLSQQDMKRILDDAGFRGKFTCVYVPEVYVRRSRQGSGGATPRHRPRCRPRSLWRCVCVCVRVWLYERLAPPWRRTP